MTNWFLVGLGVLGIVFLRWLHKQPVRDVSAAWVIEQERKEWTQGIDGPCWQWDRLRKKDTYGVVGSAVDTWRGCD